MLGLWVLLPAVIGAVAAFIAAWWHSPELLWGILILIVLPSSLFLASALLDAAWSLGNWLLQRTQFRRWTGALALPRRPRRILYLGPDTAEAGWMLARRFRDAFVVERINLEPSSSNSVEQAVCAGRSYCYHSAHLAALPVAEADFDLVVTGLPVDTLPAADGLRRALQIVWRLVAPGGTLLVFDLTRVPEYAGLLRELSGAEPGVHDVGWDPRLVWPWRRARVLSATKSLAAVSSPQSLAQTRSRRPPG